MRWFNFNQYPHKNPKKHKMDSRLFSLINYTTNFNSCHFSFLKHQRLITIWIRCITHIMVLGSYYQHFFFQIFHLEPNVTNREWTHHHRKHATLVDMVGHFHHTQQSAQLALLVFVYYILLIPFVNNYSRPVTLSTLHQFFGVVETMQTIPSLLKKKKYIYIYIYYKSFRSIWKTQWV